MHCWADHQFIRCNKLAHDLYQKCPNQLGIWSSSIMRFLGATWVCPSNNTSIGSAIFAQITCVSNTERSRDRVTCVVSSKCSHLCTVCTPHSPKLSTNAHNWSTVATIQQDVCVCTTWCTVSSYCKTSSMAIQPKFLILWLHRSRGNFALNSKKTNIKAK